MSRQPPHPTASESFSAVAATYERARPDYPREAVEWLLERLRVAAGTTVVDLGAGTGKLTTHLLPTGATVIAVEPLAEMRRLLERKLPPVRVIDAVAEELPLIADSARAVVAAQAFHWFDPSLALPEIDRVLEAGGRLGLIWNRRNVHQPLQAAIGDLIEPYRGDTPAHRAGAWRRALDASPLVFRQEAEIEQPHEQRLDRDGLVDRVGSISFIAALPDRERRRVLSQVRELALAGLSYVAEAFIYARSEARKPAK